jgi:IPT/TIG domain
MDRIRQGIVEACARQARDLVSVILATAGVVVLATACAACGQAAPSAGGGEAADPSPDMATSSAAGSLVAAAGGHSVNSNAGGSNGSASNAGGSNGSASNAGGSNGSGCPTREIGGDSVAPLCVTPATSPDSGISGPASASPTPPQAQQSQPQPAPPAAAPLQVTGISPASGGTAGGDSVTITGSGFTAATEVEFGSVTAQMTVDSDTQITAISPPGSGTVGITVVTPDGTSAPSPADLFTYQG